eukprot:TRINITY_DN24885_c0_g1_i1.p1 TRINITY_DN24885_c0_g1~~TRINITY_DN24885_c0_g1_i1.p1  ORF type:complete len:215 (-),score=17.00 TRINITY_DN24885_c0_g1_i1:60-704(-)
MFQNVNTIRPPTARVAMIPNRTAQNDCTADAVIRWRLEVAQTSPPGRDERPSLDSAPPTRQHSRLRTSDQLMIFAYPCSRRCNQDNICVELAIRDANLKGTKLFDTFQQRFAILAPVRRRSSPRFQADELFPTQLKESHRSRIAVIQDRGSFGAVRQQAEVRVPELRVRARRSSGTAELPLSKPRCPRLACHQQMFSQASTDAGASLPKVAHAK